MRYAIVTMLVPAKPFVELNKLFRNNLSADTFWSNNISHHISGSHALNFALDYLKILPGATVVLPALICRSVSDVLSNRGLVPYFIDSESDSVFPDAISLTQACRSTNAQVLYLVDFFGFLPNERLSICKNVRESGCIVFEDRCHSALTQPSVEVADAVIYSLRKTLPCRDGGVVRFSTLYQSPINSGLIPSITDLFFLLRCTLEYAVCSLGAPNIYDRRYNLMRNTKTTVGENVESELFYSTIRNNANNSPSYVLYRQLLNVDYIARISNLRRNNYVAMQNVVANLGLSLGFDRLPHDVVPQVIPLVDPSGTLVDFMRASGIGATRWPDYDLPEFVREHPELFPNACRFNRQMAYLPIHQSINSNHISLMANCLKKWKKTLDTKNMDGASWK